MIISVDHLVGGDWNIFFPFSWEFQKIPTDELICFRGVGIPPTRSCLNFFSSLDVTLSFWYVGGMFHGPKGSSPNVCRAVPRAKEEGSLLLRSRAAFWRRIAPGRFARQPLRTGSQDS